MLAQRRGKLLCSALWLALALLAPRARAAVAVSPFVSQTYMDDFPVAPQPDGLVGPMDCASRDGFVYISSYQ